MQVLIQKRGPRTKPIARDRTAAARRRLRADFGANEAIYEREYVKRDGRGFRGQGRPQGVVRADEVGAGPLTVSTSDFFAAARSVAIRPAGSAIARGQAVELQTDMGGFGERVGEGDRLIEGDASFVGAVKLIRSAPLTPK